MQTVSPNPIVLSRALDQADEAWYTWEPEAIHDTARDAGYDTSEVSVLDMLGALCVLKAQTEQFWSEWEVFENIVHALNGNVPDFSQVQPASPAETAFAVGAASEIASGDMSYEVKAYVEAILHSNGLSFGTMSLEGIHDRSSHPDRRQEVAARYEALMDQEDPDITESAVDIEALKMLAIGAYVRHNHLCSK